MRSSSVSLSSSRASRAMWSTSSRVIIGAGAARPPHSVGGLRQGATRLRSSCRSPIHQSSSRLAYWSESCFLPTEAKRTVTSVSAPLRSRDPDVAEPPLFLELVHRVHRADVREDPLLHAREKDDGELEPLRRVEGHEGDAARALR